MWDPGCGTRELPPGNLHLGPGTRDPQAAPEIRDLGSSTQDPSTGTRDPICGNRDQTPLHGTRDPYVVALTFKELSLNVQFSSIDQFFQTGIYTNLHNRTEKQITQLIVYSLSWLFLGTYLKITNWHRSGQLICNKVVLCY